MKKLLGIVVLGLLWSTNVYAFCIFNCKVVSVNLVCNGNPVKEDKKYIYEYFGNGDVNKYKITNKNISYVSGFLKGRSGFNYNASLDLVGETLTVNKTDRDTGISGSYTKECY